MTCAYISFMEYEGVKHFRALAEARQFDITEWTDENIVDAANLFAEFFDENMPLNTIQNWLNHRSQY